MVDKLKADAKSKIKGRTAVLFLLCLSLFFCFIITVGFLAFSLYSFFERISFFELPYLYYSAVSFLFFLASSYYFEKLNIYIKIRYYRLFVPNLMSRGYTCKIVIKYLLFRTEIFFKKFCLLVCYIIPSLLIAVTASVLLSRGVDIGIFLCFACSFISVFTVGLFCYLKEKQKFSYCDIIFFKNRHLKNNDIIKEGALKADGHCGKILKIKLEALRYAIPCIFIVPSVYYVPLIIAVLFKYLTYDESFKNEKAIVYNLPMNGYDYISKTAWDVE